MNLFTSDTHFGHKNIIKYSKRPFADVEEMDSELIKRWNAVVKPTDDIYHLGDFAFLKQPDYILYALNGRKHFITGNHDSEYVRSMNGWASVQPYLEIIEDGQMIVMCHYAMRVWNKSHHGSIMIYGHSHGSLPGSSQSLDVGVDAGWDYAPCSLKQIQTKLKTLPEYKAQDHHLNRKS